MSDTSEDLCKDHSIESSLDSVCRDFLRGMCERKYCKFKHEHEPKTLNFCHDHQNVTCPRPSCKFIHCSPAEVELFKKSGEMSNQILAEAIRKNQLPGIPICNSYRRGTCKRPYCRYRHINREEEELEIMELLKNNSGLNHPTNCGGSIIVINEPPQNHHENIHRRAYQFDDMSDMGPLTKRRLLSCEFDCADVTNDTTFKGYYAGNPPSVLSRLDARNIMLEEENSLLQKEIAQLKKQVSDLTATNEFLLDQNATLRMSTKRNGTVTMPAVTITNSLPQNSQGQVIRTVAASVATVPVSLATVTTCNPVSIAGCSAVSIAPPNQMLAPSQQILVTTNQPTQLALASSSQAQLAIAQQNLANNLAQQAQPQLTSQAQQLALATTSQQLTSQAQHMANQQLALASASQQITSQSQQIAINNSQQLAMATNAQSHMTSQAQQQLALATSNQQMTSQVQQLAMANTTQQLAVANVSQQLIASTGQQLLAAQQNLANSQQMEMHEMHRTNQLNTSQTIAMSNATAPMVSYPIMTHAMPH